VGAVADMPGGRAVLVSQGVVQNLRPYTNATLMEPQVVEKTSADGVVKRDTVTTQVIAQGPTACQEAIKMLGTNGGGLFNSTVYGTTKSGALQKQTFS
jgi:K+-transporting ATPase ATPase A chain